MRRALRLAAAGAVLLGAMSCGSGPQQAPAAVRAALARVDAAVAARDYGLARQSVDVLVRQTLAARDRGELSPVQADRVLAAAARLAVDLPQPRPTVTVAPTPTVTQQDGNGGGEKKKGKGRKKHGD
jgi:hypothetical protein